MSTMVEVPWAVALDAMIDSWRERASDGPEEAQAMLHVLLHHVGLSLCHESIERDEALALVDSYIEGWAGGELRREVPDERFVVGDYLSSWEEGT